MVICLLIREALSGAFLYCDEINPVKRCERGARILSLLSILYSRQIRRPSADILVTSASSTGERRL